MDDILLYDYSQVKCLDRLSYSLCICCYCIANLLDECCAYICCDNL